MNSESTANSFVRAASQKRRGWPWRKLGASMLIVALLGAGGFRLLTTAGQSASTSELVTQPVQRKTVAVTITANGTVDAERSINLSPKTAGVIRELYVKEGDRVRQGQVVAVMDDSDLQGQLVQMQGQLRQQQANLRQLEAGSRPQETAQLEARLQEAQVTLRLREQEVQRQQRLYSEGAVSRQDLDQVITDRDVAKTQVAEAQQGLSLDQAGTRPEQIDQARGQVQAAQGSLLNIQNQIDDTKIVAPFDGVVTRKFTDVGAFVSPSMSGGSTESASSSSILTLASDRQQIVVNLSEAQIAKVKVGQSASFTVDAFPGERFTGRVAQIAAQATVTQNVTSFEVRIAVTPASDKLKVGMNVEAQFEVGRLENALLVPNAAVVRRSAGEGVYVLDGERQPVFRSIQVGATAAGQTEVKSGLEGNEQVLVSPPPSDPKSGGFSIIPRAPQQ